MILFSFSLSLIQDVSAKLQIVPPSNSKISNTRPSDLLLLLLLTCVPPHTKSVSFDFNNFYQTENIKFEGDAYPSNGTIQLTKNQLDASASYSKGRASYLQPIPLWDSRTKRLTDFSTNFSFIIKQIGNYTPGDGLAFFLAPFNSSIPDNSEGGALGLFSSETYDKPKLNRIVAVEFDTYINPWDPVSSHVGIDVNSLFSVANVTWQSSMTNGTTANAWVTYNSTTQNLGVFLTYADNPIFDGNFSLSYNINLSTVLPETIRVGFSAATGSGIEVNSILSWSFNSTLNTDRRSKIRLIAGIAAVLGVLICGLGFYWFISPRKRSSKTDDGSAFEVDDDFEKGTGPKSFSYRELSQATNNFAEEGKLGEGGFGGVYRGLLTNPTTEIAVKRVSKGSKQGKKEYVSEVRIISRLRHRNLVQLIGWCHEKGELLLVYEFMPNGSLDSHLFGSKCALPWPVRHKIALGLASALNYLHEEWEQCVVHRDIKSSNVMLDSNFNAKLGDFGLARLVDHDLGSQTTVLAGTVGYLAPECLITGKSSKESDVYSFGVVALEIACGRKSVKLEEEPSKVRIVEWVWDLYGKGLLIEAIDRTLGGQYDERQIESLMVVGLWCCHPDYTLRPSIKQAINALNFEAPLPILPSKSPVPVYLPPMNMAMFSFALAASTAITSSERNQGQTSSSGSCSTGSSLQLACSSISPLLRDMPDV
ncbi:hypothetical protein Nepgr_027122 [Nepenthes gracilis]|uniref:non-specific serine/threonine protein kinase n=1 Tax=Nepenthes gracilis TaxID=150966 RepID=A0AAD3TAA0_NEPGR|nr:hypothetical protein Nepgr_027122 [Nepenthes gracilis]